jgi:hypothetical protein
VDERKPIILSHNSVALIQIFTKYDDWLDISIGAWDKFMADEGYREAAREFVRQLKGQWCETFMEELKKEIEEELEKARKEREAYNEVYNA